MRAQRMQRWLVGSGRQSPIVVGDIEPERRRNSNEETDDKPKFTHAPKELLCGTQTDNTSVKQL